MEIPVQAKEVCSRQIRCMSRKRDAERNESSEACEPCAEKSRYCFIDYLSFLTIRAEKCSKMPCLDWQNYIILNSVSNLHKAIDGLAVYERIHCFFDKDRAGTEAFQRLANEYSYRVRDASHTYKDCKDLNEYLVRQRSVQEQKTEQIVPPKRSKGRSL